MLKNLQRHRSHHQGGVLGTNILNSIALVKFWIFRIKAEESEEEWESRKRNNGVKITRTFTGGLQKIEEGTIQSGGPAANKWGQLAPL